MKGLLLVLVLVITLIAIPATVFLAVQRQELRQKAAPATTLSLLPGSLNKKVGDVFTLEVTIDTAENQVATADIYLVFDPTKIEAQTITNGSLFPNILTSGVIERGTASITVGAPGAATPVKGVGTVAVARFKALDSTATPTAIRFANNNAVHAIGEGSVNVLVGTTPATVTIAGLGAETTQLSATPSAQLTPTLTPPLEASPGSEASPSALKILTPTADSTASDNQPVIKGKASPGATVTITIYSTPQTVVVTADANGNWIYTPTKPLEEGPHNIVATSQNPTTGGTETASRSFVVATSQNGATQSAVPISGNSTPTLLLTAGAILFIIIGISIPVLLGNQ